MSSFTKTEGNFLSAHFAEKLFLKDAELCDIVCAKIKNHQHCVLIDNYNWQRYLVKNVNKKLLPWI
jgi:hypothetical protein